MNILKVYISKTGKKVNTDNLILNQNSYYNTLQLYTESYYPEVVCTFKDSNGKLSPKCHMIFKGKQQDEKYLYEYPIPFAITSFVIPNMSGRLDTSFVCYENKGGNLVYPTIANVAILVNKSNGNAVLDNSYNGTDVENLWKVVGDLILRTSPDGGDKQDVLIPGRYIEITKENIINVLPIDYSYITNKPLIPTKLSQLENDIDVSGIKVIDPALNMLILKGLEIAGTQYRLPAYDIAFSDTEVEGSGTLKNIHLYGKDYFVGGITDAEKQDIQSQLDLKANKDETYTITKVNELLANKVNTSDIYSKDELNTKFNEKANTADVYTIKDLDPLLNSKANKDDVYNIQTMNDKLNLKANVSDVYTQLEVNGLLQNKVDNSYLTENYYTQTQIDNKLTSALVYKGSVATVADLPKTKNKVGDFWNVLEDDSNYAWDGKKWDKVGGSGEKVDLSDYYTISQIDDKEKVLQTDINNRLLTTEFNSFKASNATELEGINNKFNNYYTQESTNILLNGKINVGDVYDKETINDKLLLKADANNVYTKDLLYTQSEVNELLLTKQDTGDYALKTDFKTINNENIIGTGNIEVKAGSDVFANPVLVGNEEYLDGLEVSGEKYKIGAEDMVFSEETVPGSFKLKNIRIRDDNWEIVGGGGTDITVDTELSDVSHNPVENQTITNEINRVKTKLLNISIDPTDKVLIIE